MPTKIETMKTIALNLKFVTPAFLGNAEQSAQWRTPPIKALLRQWWRVAYATSVGFNVDLDAMRRAEAALFGSVGTDDQLTPSGQRKANKSAVRIRLSTWKNGTLETWSAAGKVTHPEVDNGKQVGSDLYLGFGPLVNHKGSVALKQGPAIKSEDEAKLSIAYPETSAQELELAFNLLHKFGALGGRSRNAWGSFSLTPENIDLSEYSMRFSLPLRTLSDCLRLDWPHAIGQDIEGHPLIWETQPLDRWEDVVTSLARIKIKLRTHFKFPETPVDGKIHERHWLSYPVTKHSVSAWEKKPGGPKSLRLPNTLRFKARSTSNGKLTGVIFHMPHLPPQQFEPNLQEIEGVWRRVFQILDDPAQKLTRILS